MIREALPQCPNCGATVKLGMTTCPYCHTTFTVSDDVTPDQQPVTPPPDPQPTQQPQSPRKKPRKVRQKQSRWYDHPKLVGFITVALIIGAFAGYFKFQAIKPLVKQKVHVEDVMNGSNDAVIGKCAYISVSEKKLKNTSQKEFKDLCDYVDTLDYNWFAVKAGSQKGICFTGCNTDMPIYGVLDSDGSLYKTIGFITKDDNGNYIFTESTE